MKELKIVNNIGMTITRINVDFDHIDYIRRSDNILHIKKDFNFKTMTELEKRLIKFGPDMPKET